MQNTKNTALILVLLLLAAPLAHGDTIKVINYAPYSQSRLRTHHPHSPHRQAISQIESLVDNLMQLVEQAKLSEGRGMDCEEDDSSWDDSKPTQERKIKMETAEKDVRDGWKKSSIPTELVVDTSAEESLKKEIASVDSLADKIKLQIDAINENKAIPQQIQKQTKLSSSESETKDKKVEIPIASYNPDQKNQVYSHKEKEVIANPILEQRQELSQLPVVEKEINKEDLYISSKPLKVSQHSITLPSQQKTETKSEIKTETPEKVTLTVSEGQAKVNKNIIQESPKTDQQAKSQDIIKQDSSKTNQQIQKAQSEQHKNESKQSEKILSNDSKDLSKEEKMKVEEPTEKRVQSDKAQEKHNQSTVDPVKEDTKVQKEEKIQEKPVKKENNEKQIKDQPAHELVKTQSQEQKTAVAPVENKIQKVDEVQHHTSWPQIKESSQQTEHNLIPSLHHDESLPIEQKTPVAQTTPVEVKTIIPSTETHSAAPVVVQAPSEVKEQIPNIKTEQKNIDVKIASDSSIPLSTASQITLEVNQAKSDHSNQQNKKQQEKKSVVVDEKTKETVKQDLPKQEYVQESSKKQQQIVEQPKKELIEKQAVKEEPVQVLPAKEQQVKQQPIKEQTIKEEPIKAEPVKETSSTVEPIKEQAAKEEAIHHQMKQEPLQQKSILQEQIKKDVSKEQNIAQPISSENKHQLSPEIVSTTTKTTVSESLPDETLKNNHDEAQQTKQTVTAQPQVTKSLPATIEPSKEEPITKQTKIETSNKEIIVNQQEKKEESSVVVPHKDETHSANEIPEIKAITETNKQVSTSSIAPLEQKPADKVGSEKQNIEQTVVVPTNVKTSESIAPVESNLSKSEHKQQTISESVKSTQTAPQTPIQVLPAEPALPNLNQESSVISEIKHIEQIHPEHVQIIENSSPLQSSSENQITLQKVDIPLEIIATTDSQQVKSNPSVETLSKNTAESHSEQITTPQQIQSSVSHETQTSSQTETLSPSPITVTSLPTASNSTQTKIISTEEEVVQEVPFMPSICVPMCDFTSSSPICDRQQCRACRDDNECSEELSLFEVLSDNLTVTCHIPSGKCLKQTK